MRPSLFLLAQCLMALVMNAQPEPIPPPLAASAEKVEPSQVFIGGFRFMGRPLAVTAATYVTLDGKLTPYWDVPDEGTELIELGIDLRRNTITRMAYLTRKDL